MDDLEITAEQMATFRACRFEHRVFQTYPSLRAKEPFPNDAMPPESREGEWYASQRYTGESFDPEKWEVEDGGWDHEHCDVCWAKVTDGMYYWPNVDPNAGHVDLCETCYERVMKLL